MVALKATFVALSLFSLVQAVPRPLGRRTDSYSGGSSGGSYGGSSGGSSGGSYGGSSGGSSGGSYGGSSGGSYGGSSGGSYGGSSGGSSGGSYGGSSGGSYGGSSGGSYGGSSGGNSGYNGGSSSSSSSSMMMESSSSSMMMESSSSSMMMESSTMSSMSTPPPMMQESSSMMMSSSSTMMMESSSSIPPPAETASSSMSMPSYGSGSSNWGNNGYDSCVQQCMASYAPPSSMYTQPPMPNGYDTSAKGSSGKVYTVIVAPKQGVLRFVPFSVQAQPGDTIRFRWGAGPHTVTKSSELEVCNATNAQPFASGKQNVGFTFDQVVNDTNPVYFYCGVQPHCEKGMFGILNPPSVDNNAAPMSVGSMLNSTTDPALMAKIAMVSKAVANSTAAANWGGKFDMSKIPAASQSAFLDNVLLTRVTIAENTDQFDGQNFNPSNAFNLPDGYLAMDAATDSTNNAAAASSGGAPASSGTSAAPATQTSKKAAASRSVATSSGAIVAAVVAAAFFSL